MSFSVDIAVGGNPSSKSNPLSVADQPLAFIADTTTSATYTYLCEALPGTLASAAAWRVSRIEKATGVCTWADGNSDFDNVANNRASLTYS